MNIWGTLILTSLSFAGYWSLPSTTHAQANDPIFVGENDTLSTIEKRLRNASPREFKPVGTTSVVFRMKFIGEKTHRGAFRPPTATHARGHASEIAAYRIARALDFDNVPPVVEKCVSERDVDKYFGRAYRQDWPGYREEMKWDNERSCGSLTHWIPSMKSVKLDSDEYTARWRNWLKQSSTLPKDENARVLARDISNMLVFDFLIGNSDRFSGSNISRMRNGTRLFLRDHNHSFHRLSGKRYERVSKVFKCERFSKHTIKRVVAMSPKELKARMGDWLSDTQMQMLADRRQALLSYITALSDEYGEAAILSMP